MSPEQTVLGIIYGFLFGLFVALFSSREEFSKLGFGFGFGFGFVVGNQGVQGYIRIKVMDYKGIRVRACTIQIAINKDPPARRIKPLGSTGFSFLFLFRGLMVQFAFPFAFPLSLLIRLSFPFSLANKLSKVNNEILFSA